MEIAELHKILGDENKTISLEEYQNIIWELRNDSTLMLLDKNLDIKEASWYCGESNGFQIALDLSEHIEQLQNQKAIECLKEIRQDVLVDNCEDYSVDLNYLVELIDTKIKELEGE